MSEQYRSDEEPLYNIGAVSRMTDVAETTLRIWERRYNFPQSSRTDGGHRLYSPREVARLKWVKSKLDAGMQISRAIKALYHAESDDTGIAPPIASPAADSAAFASVEVPLWEALTQHNATAARQLIMEVLTVYPLEYLIMEVISPLMAEIGRAWEDGELDSSTEHFATNFLRNYLFQWIEMGPPSYDINPVVLACAPGELHEGSLLMMAVLLRRLRWPITYLGQTIDLTDFANFIEHNQPSAIVFVAMTAESAQALSEWPQLLPKVYADKRPLVCFGGRIFSIDEAYIEQVEGLFLGKTLQEGIARLDRLLHELYPLPH